MRGPATFILGAMLLLTVTGSRTQETQGAIPDQDAAAKAVRQALISHKKKLVGEPVQLTKIKLKGATNVIKDVTEKGVVVETSFGGGAVSNTTAWEKIPAEKILGWVKKAVPKPDEPSWRGLIVWLSAQGMKAEAQGELDRAHAAGVRVEDIRAAWAVRAEAERKAGQIRKRRVLLTTNGGSDKTEAAVLAGLGWLARHQSVDGSWEVKGFRKQCGKSLAFMGACDPAPGHTSFHAGITGLAVSAFLGAGYGPDSKEENDGIRFGDVIRKGLDWIVARQDPEGCIGSRAVQKYTYNHLICAAALIDAWGRTKDPKLKGPAAKALTFTLASQNPGKAWRYSLGCGDNDSSVTGWAVKVLVKARKEGLDVPGSAVTGVRTWFREATEPDSGYVGYTRSGTGKVFVPGLNEKFEHHHTLSAIGTVAQVTLREPGLHPGYRNMLDQIGKDVPRWDPNFIDYYYWFHASEALLLAEGARGKNWQPWSRKLVGTLVDHQNREGTGCKSGSWEPVDRWSGEAGRVYGTALNVLTLEVFYRLTE